MAPERGFRLIQQFIEKQPIYAKSWAICVGINEYQGGQGRLANAVNDAKAVAQLLRDTYHFEEVHTLYDGAATRSAITAWLSDELPDLTGEHDRLIFFFAGHGVTRQRVRGEGQRGYLIPADAASGKYADYIEMGELARACADIPAKHIFFILDCCFSGVAAVAARAEAAPAKVVDDPYLRRITEKHAWQILTAGDSDDAVADSGLRPGHSVFTSVLLDGLAGLADTNRDGLMTATDLSAYVKPLVALQSQVATGRSQVPFAGYLAGSGQGEFAFLLPDAELKAEVVVNAPVKPPENLVPLRRQIARPIDFDWITIPAGDFLMGSDKAKDASAFGDELPQHTLYLPTYRIAKVPVTNAQYKQFVDAQGYQLPSHWKDGKIPNGKEQHPVVRVSWHDALAFCTWAGVSLPTEAEWEKAASWDESNQMKRVYPWGNQFDANRCNSIDSGINDTTPVEKYQNGVSPYGVLDMAGNVWEWTGSLYKGYPYKADDRREDVAAAGRRVVRGGSFGIFRSILRCAYRLNLDPAFRRDYIGFRVVSPGS